jgi:hypothetical protein
MGDSHYMQASSTTVMRFMLIGVTMVLVTHAYGADIIRLLIPLYEWMVKQFEYRLSTVDFSIIKQHGEQFLLLQTTLSRPIFTGTNVIVPNAPIPSVASMPVGHVMFPVIVIFTTVLAWPVPKRDAKMYIFIMRILLALPICVLVMLADVPIQMLKLIWESLNTTLGLTVSSDLAYFNAWSDFLNGGGLIAISIAAAILILGFIQHLVKRDPLPSSQSNF